VDLDLGNLLFAKKALFEWFFSLGFSMLVTKIFGYLGDRS
jgi:hypothetical protein